MGHIKTLLRALATFSWLVNWLKAKFKQAEVSSAIKEAQETDDTSKLEELTNRPR